MERALKRPNVREISPSSGKGQCDTDGEAAGLEWLRQEWDNAESSHYRQYKVLGRIRYSARVSWKEVDSQRIDKKRLKAEKPEVYAEYQKTIRSRRLTVKAA